MEIILIHELRMPTARLGMTGFGEVEKLRWMICSNLSCEGTFDIDKLINIDE